ncbi:MAG: GNAT family N-acetyltransferase [Acidimicrobiales bacterium]
MQEPDEPAAREAERALPARSEDLERLAELVEQAVDALGAARGGEQLLAEGELAGLAARDRPPDRLSDGPPGKAAAGGLAALLASRDALLLGGWYSGALVGVALAERTGGRETHSVPVTGRLRLLYVEPGARGVGVGHALLEAVLRWCADLRCAAIDVAALPGDRATKSLLERHGFRARVIVMSRLLG